MRTLCSLPVSMAGGLLVACQAALASRNHASALAEVMLKSC